MTIKYSKQQVEQITRRQRSMGHKSAAIKMGDALLEFLHMMYNKQTARSVLNVLITHLRNHQTDFQ
ncbi:MAG: hypothetical protein MUP27_08850 [Desulfobacterales bacterium]|nr:hypothetical protein [Desulfobacterales bacterium]